MICDDVRVEAGGLDHDEEAVVAADQVAEVLPRLNRRVVTTNQEEKQLPELVKLTCLKNGYTFSIIFIFLILKPILLKFITIIKAANVITLGQTKRDNII